MGNIRHRHQQQPIALCRLSIVQCASKQIYTTSSSSSSSCEKKCSAKGKWFFSLFNSNQANKLHRIEPRERLRADCVRLLRAQFSNPKAANNRLLYSSEVTNEQKIFIFFATFHFGVALRSFFFWLYECAKHLNSKEKKIGKLQLHRMTLNAIGMKCITSEKKPPLLVRYFVSDNLAFFCSYAAPCVYLIRSHGSCAHGIPHKRASQNEIANKQCNVFISREHTKWQSYLIIMIASSKYNLYTPRDWERRKKTSKLVWFHLCALFFASFASKQINVWPCCNCVYFVEKKALNTKNNNNNKFVIYTTQWAEHCCRTLNAYIVCVWLCVWFVNKIK